MALARNRNSKQNIFKSEPCVDAKIPLCPIGPAVGGWYSDATAVPRQEMALAWLRAACLARVVQTLCISSYPGFLPRLQVGAICFCAGDDLAFLGGQWGPHREKPAGVAVCAEGGTWFRSSGLAQD